MIARLVQAAMPRHNDLNQLDDGIAEVTREVYFFMSPSLKKAPGYNLQDTSTRKSPQT